MLNNPSRLENNSIEDVQTEAAFKLNSTENNYYTLLDFLRSDSLNLVYYALLKVERFKTKEDALILFNLLNPDNDSRVREQASDLIKNHITDKEYRHYFDNEDTVMFLTESIMDKNPKVCRNITYALQKTNYTFQIIEKLFIIIEEQLKNSKKEQIKNRAIFIIYWSLFAIENILNPEIKTVDLMERLIETIQKTSKFKEYQIRERSASIVRNLNRHNKHEKLVQLTEQLLSDENFYVKTAISGFSSFQIQKEK